MGKKRRKPDKPAEITFEYALHSAMKRANVKQHIACHMFRHTSATNFIQLGGDIKTLQYYLEHSDISVTSIYLHNDEEKNRENQEKYSALNLLKSNTQKKKISIKSHSRKY